MTEDVNPRPTIKTSTAYRVPGQRPILRLAAGGPGQIFAVTADNEILYFGIAAESAASLPLCEPIVAICPDGHGTLAVGCQHRLVMVRYSRDSLSISKDWPTGNAEVACLESWQPGTFILTCADGKRYRIREQDDAYDRNPLFAISVSEELQADGTSLTVPLRDLANIYEGQSARLSYCHAAGGEFVRVLSTTHSKSGLNWDERRLYVFNLENGEVVAFANLDRSINCVCAGPKQDQFHIGTSDGEVVELNIIPPQLSLEDSLRKAGWEL